MNTHNKQDASQSEMPYQSTHLFLVRVWLDKHANGADAAKLCGRIQDVSTAHVHNFHSVMELEKLMLSMIPQGEMLRPSTTAKNTKHEDQV